MTSFAQWINDRRWAANMRRARAFRRRLSLSERILFDKALCPCKWLAYPDAVYYVEILDLLRAMQTVHDHRRELDIYGDPEDH